MHRSPFTAVLPILAIAAALSLLAAAPAAAESDVPEQPAAAAVDAPETAPAEAGCGAAADPVAALADPEAEPAQCSAAPEAASLPEPAQGPPFLRGFCHCGCGIGCETSADCGGAPCRRFVTCC